MRRPKTESVRVFLLIFPTTISIPTGSALVFKTSIVWEWHFSETRYLFFFESRVLLKNIIIASAAAVPSSKRDALASGKPVRSVTIV